MTYFNEICVHRGLNKGSSFEDIAQACIEAYYLAPYPHMADVSQSKTRINRPIHGAVHAARTALCAEMFIGLYQKYASELVQNASGGPLLERDIVLLKLAAVYHDSANTSEIMGKGSEHAENFSRDMCSLGYTHEEIAPFAKAIIDKDDSTDSKSFFEKIIHDADCLEIIRVRTIYKKEFLDIFQYIPEGTANKAFHQELSDIIATHTETILMIEKENEGSFHVALEFSDNCYIQIRNKLRNMLFNKAVLEAAKQGLALPLPTMDRYTILDLFNRTDRSPAIQKLIKDNAQPFETKEEKSDDRVLYLYQTSGLVARAIRGNSIDVELSILEANTLALQKASIKSVIEMRAFLSRQGTKAFVPPGFKWRPCSFIAKGLPISLFGSATAGVLIDPHPESGAFLSHFYKKNIFSSGAKTGMLDYYCSNTGRKERQSLENLRDKSIEVNQRREGRSIDANAHYFGRETLSHSEELGTYRPESICGIFVKDLKQKSLEDALLLQAYCRLPLRPIFLYSETLGLQKLSMNTILKQITTSPYDYQLHRLGQILGAASPITVTAREMDEICRFSQQEKMPNHNIDKFEITLPIGLSEFQLKKIKYLIGSTKKLRNPDEEPLSSPSELALIDTISPFKILAFFTRGEVDDEQIMPPLPTEDYFTVLLDVLNCGLEDDTAIDDRECFDRVEGFLNQLENEPGAVGSFKALDLRQSDSSQVSDQKPLKYFFLHPSDPGITCEAYVRNGQPIIEMAFPDGRTVFRKTNRLPTLCEHYLRQSVGKLKSFVEESGPKQALLEMGLLDLHIELVQTSKIEINLSFQAKAGLEKTAVQEKLLQFLGQPRIKVRPAHLAYSDGRCHFSVIDVQKIDTILKQLEPKPSVPIESKTEIESKPKQINLKLAKALYQKEASIFSRQAKKIFGIDKALKEPNEVLALLKSKASSHNGASRKTLSKIQNQEANCVTEPFDVLKARNYYRNHCRFFTTHLDKIFGKTNALKSAHEVVENLQKRVENRGASMETLVYLSKLQN